MIGVTFNPSLLQDEEQLAFWNTWQVRAEKATHSAIDQFEEWLIGPRSIPFHLNFQSPIWKELKDWLLENVFPDKCAYCERAISGYYGDAEHFRPKGAVKAIGANRSAVIPECKFVHPVDGSEVAMIHPGYFWLAYDWRNLLPSCVYCNSGQGKNERFDTANAHVFWMELSDLELQDIPPHCIPIASRKWPDRYYYHSPQWLDRLEDPLFLSPLNPTPERDPRILLKFTLAGKVVPKAGSMIAERTVEIFGLNNAKLCVLRQKAQESFRLKYFDLLRDLDPEEPGHAKVQKFINDYAAGKYPFSAAALEYYRVFYNAFPRPA